MSTPHVPQRRMSTAHVPHGARQHSVHAQVWEDFIVKKGDWVPLQLAPKSIHGCIEGTQHSVRDTTKVASAWLASRTDRQQHQILSPSKVALSGQLHLD